MRILMLAATMVLTLNSCNSPRQKQVASLATSTTSDSPDQLDLQGHRGCRGLLPENSIPAFLHALELGVTTLELDVVVSRDSQVLVSHEPWLSHVICRDPSGAPIAEGSEKVWNLYQMDYATIRDCDCGSRRHPQFPEQQLLPTYKPLLSEVIDSVRDYCQSRQQPLPFFNIETKSQPTGDEIYHPEPQRFVELLLAVIEEKDITDRTYLQSFDPRTLRVARQQAPDIPLVLLVGEPGGPATYLDSLGFVPAGYSPAYPLVDAALVAFCEDKQMQLIPWTVNDPDDMQRMLDLGVDGIITDYPDRLLALISSR